MKILKRKEKVDFSETFTTTTPKQFNSQQTGKSKIKVQLMTYAGRNEIENKMTQKMQKIANRKACTTEI